MSTAMRFTLPVIFSLIVSLAHAAEPPAEGPAVDTSKINVSRSADSDRNAAAQPSAQPSTTSQRASGPQAVVRNDRLQLDTTTVTGNRELPKVLYIVPWKKSDLGDLPAQPFNTLLDEALTPVDRDVFRREVTYYGAMKGDADAAPSPSERTEK